MDGTDCPIEQKGKRWYSHKFRKPGVCYEVGVAIISGDICWIKGPLPCGNYNDLKIFRMALEKSLDEGEYVETDLGYQGRNVKSRCPKGPLTAGRPVYTEMKKRVASRHETVNQRLKIFSCLVKRFRHSCWHHAHCFRAVAILVQLMMESGEKLFNADYCDHVD